MKQYLKHYLANFVSFVKLILFTFAFLLTLFLPSVIAVVMLALNWSTTALMSIVWLLCVVGGYTKMDESGIFD